MSRLIPTLNLVSRYGFKHRTFSTNGYGLLQDYQEKPVLQYMKETGAIYNISLSRMHMDSSINAVLMNGQTIHISEMKQIASFCTVNNMDIRLSCNLMRDGILSFEDMLKYIDFAENIGYKNIIFRELVNNKWKYIDIHPIMNQIIKDNRFNYIQTMDGYHYNIDIYRYKNYIVKLYHQKTMNLELISNLVYREGVLTNSWNSNKTYEV